MINLNECKFGDKLRTRGGRMAVFLHKSFVDHEVYICVIENGKCRHHQIRYKANGERYYDNVPSEFDIESKWEDEKNDDEKDICITANKRYWFYNQAEN